MKNEHGVVTDKEADASIESIKAGNVVPAGEFFDSCDIGKAGIAPAASGRNPDQLSSAELKLLRAIIDEPMLRSSEYAKLAGISPNTLLKIRPGLVDRGFIRENKQETHSRGRAAILLEPLDPARQIVADRKE